MNVSSFSRFIRFFSVTNSWALMGLVSIPSPLTQPAVVCAWALPVGALGLVRVDQVLWGLNCLVAQELPGRLLFYVSFLWLHRCWHVTINTLGRVVLSF